MTEGSVRVLLVEDNPGDARLVQETLAEVSSLPFEVTHVERLSDARQKLAQERYDVVLLDLMLPDKPRMGSLIEIHDKSSRVPIIVLTGIEDETLEAWTLEEGADDYLVKGQIDGATLVRCIQHAILRRKAQEQRYRTVRARFAAPKPR